MMNLQERLGSNARHTKTGTYAQATYWVNQWQILAKDAVDENAALRAQLAEAQEQVQVLRENAWRLRDALKYYGTHSSACDMSRFVSPAGCTCGYDAAIAAEEEKE